MFFSYFFVLFSTGGQLNKPLSLLAPIFSLLNGLKVFFDSRQYNNTRVSNNKTDNLAYQEWTGLSDFESTRNVRLSDL